MSNLQMLIEVHERLEHLQQKIENHIYEEARPDPDLAWQAEREAEADRMRAAEEDLS